MSEIERYDIPPEEELQGDPTLKRVLRLYAMALRDNVDGGLNHAGDVIDLFEVYDEIHDQSCAVAKDESGRIIGVASYDLDRKTPFLEGIAVDPAARRNGVAGELARFVFDEAKSRGIHEIHSRSQPSSLEANQRMLAKIGIDSVAETKTSYPRLVIYL